MKLAERMSRLGTETAFEVLAKARALEAKGRDIVHLEIGEPDFDTPQHIVDAGIRALREGFTHYGPSAGLPELREAIADEIERTRGVRDVSPDEVVVTPGAKPIIFFTILALVNEGDEVIIPDPGFPIYESMVNYVGAKPVPITLREEREFRLDPDELAEKITDKTALVIINSPQNPTGGVLNKEDLQAIADATEKRGIPILADDIYSRILYDSEHASIYSLEGMRERTILLDGFSKTFAMTGWRLGYGVMPKDLAAAVARLQTNSTSCTAAFVQRAGIAALRGPQGPVSAMVAEFRRRRDRIVDGLINIGLPCVRPQGAFYVFPNVKSLGKTSAELQDMLLDEAGVAGLAGTSFGPAGEGYLRFSYAASIESIDRALERLKELADRLRG